MSPGSRAGWVVLTEDGPVFGPADLDDELRLRLATGEGQPFRMGEGGLIYDTGRYLGPRSGRFGPLLEDGFPNAGALWIDYATPAGWRRLRGLWLRPGWWRVLSTYREYLPILLRPANPQLTTTRR